MVSCFEILKNISTFTPSYLFCLSNWLYASNEFNLVADQILFQMKKKIIAQGNVKIFAGKTILVKKIIYKNSSISTSLWTN